ncbi:MAG: adenylyltransferase/cytidyltransferase family protein, partial [Ruminococcus flavefaciens]|nr:adenylyltransferase/cytidyltransferase family protein [Ruminococcus flavefaciens]
KVTPINKERAYPKKIENGDFFAELYGQEDYENEVAQKEIAVGTHTLDYIMNITGKYFNAKDGSRVTCFQPQKYIGTIYMLGPCMTIGSFVEDQYTIESYLQKRLLEEGYNYRVENKGAMLRLDSQIDKKLEEIGSYDVNDIVIYQSRIGEAVGIEGNSLERIFMEQRIPSTWVTDMYFHCNHKANQLIADSILTMVEPCLLNEMAQDNNAERIQIDFDAIMKKYVHDKYLNQYFCHFSWEEYKTIGAIVMNCNPFSKGHRYLIEQAKQQVELLIVFVVEEDESLFPFEERFSLIVEGTKDLKNIIVVPSGDFILSRNTFCEYFWKEENEKAICNAEYDINIFADYIAKPLHITHRFAGEEPEDKLTRIYNETMKRVLPFKGISFVEIPRLAIDNETVSASRVRKYLKNKKYDKAFALLPETTVQYLIKQI